MTKLCDQIKFEDLDGLESKVFWSLDYLSTAKKDRFSSLDISNFLIEKKRFCTSRQAVNYALNKDKHKCNKNKFGYKLMIDGEKELQKYIGNHNKILLIEADKPFSAKNFTLKTMLGNFHTEIRICDPYIDLNTLDVIFKNIEKGVPIKLLTFNILDSPPGILKRQLLSLEKEGYKIEVRVYSKNKLHDRYIINQDSLWYLGNSLNYLGQKESFIILLGNDMRESVLSTFNNHWKSSQLI